MTIDKVTDCPACRETCGWCSWTAADAREVGCGLRVPSGFGPPSKLRCDWGEKLKGTTCSTCGGDGKVRMIGRYERLQEQGR